MDRPASLRKKEIGAAAKAAPADVEPPGGAAGEAGPDPERESITAVPPLLESRRFQTVTGALYDAPDSETTLYRIPVLNRLFAVTSAVLLAFMFLVLWQDYDRQWKEIQGDFQAAQVRRYGEELREECGRHIPRLERLERPALEILERLGSRPPPLPPIPPAAGPVTRYSVAVARVARLVSSARTSLQRDPEYERRNAEVASLRNETDLQAKEVRAFKGELQAAKWELEEEKVRVRGESGTPEEARERIDRLVRAWNDQWLVHLETLQRELEELEKRRHAADAALGSYAAEKTGAGDGLSLASLEGAFREERREVEHVEKKLTEVERNWRNRVRDWPLLDFLAPTRKIEKVVLPELHESLNFLTVPRIDRCKTCHVNIDSLDPEYYGFRDPRWGSVYASHPRLDLFLGGSSPHPYESFGCTVCHHGDGHALEFTVAAHTPANRAQEEEWHRKYGWHELHHQDYPMLPLRHVTSSCGKCHGDEQWIEGADRYNYGRFLVRKYGCFGCHKISLFEIAREGETDRSWKADKVGPNLRYVADKLSPEFIYKHVRNPADFRSTSRMPRFFDLTNTSDLMLVQTQEGKLEEVDYRERNGVEALALATYVHQTSGSRADEIRPLDREGDPQRGRELVRTLGCLGCHSIQQESQSQGTQPNRELEGADEALAAVEEALRAAREGARDKPAVRALAEAYGEVAEAFGDLLGFYRRLSFGKSIERLYRRTRAAVRRARAVEEQLGVVPAFESVLTVAAAAYDRWVHNTFAPDLSFLGSKFHGMPPERARAWLADWIIDPSGHDPKTIMPSFRLAEDPDGIQKVADVVSYLMSLRDREFEAALDRAPVPETLTAAQRRVLDEIAFDYLRRTMISREAEEWVGKMTPEHKLVYVGHRLVRRYGCYGCHNGILDRDPDPAVPATPAAEEGPGLLTFFDNAQPIGTDLNGWGHKDAHQLDFGRWGHQPNDEWAIPETRHAWLEAKLQDPRRFDVVPVRKEVDGERAVYEPTNVLVQKTPEELLKMPLFPFHDDPEQVEAIVTFVISLVKDPVMEPKLARLDERERVIEAGGRLVEKLNCAGCHRIGGHAEFVALSELPSFGLAETAPEALQFAEMEKETWLARDVHLRGQPATDRSAGLELPAGTLLNTTVLDVSTLRLGADLDSPEARERIAEIDGMSVVELAQRHFDPLPAFVQDLVRAIDEFDPAKAEDPDAEYRNELEALFYKVLRARGDPHRESLVHAAKSYQDPEGSELGQALRRILENPYDEALKAWFARRANTQPWRELAERFYGLEPIATPESSRGLLVRGFGEGSVRFYFGLTPEERASAPPPLVRQGERVRGEWLFDFLLHVAPIRPWLKIRMPSFRISQEEARAIVAWFKTLSELPPANEQFSEYTLEEALARRGHEQFAKEKQCNQCHPAEGSLPSLPQLEPAGRIDPQEVPVQGTGREDGFFIVWKEPDGTVGLEAGFPDRESAERAAKARFQEDSMRWAVGAPWDKISWGPDLTRARERLRPPWIRDWLAFPPDLMPGTKMPSYWGRAKLTGARRDAHLDDVDPGSEKKLYPTAREDIETLIQYLMHMKRADVVAQRGR